MVGSSLPDFPAFPGSDLFMPRSIERANLTEVTAIGHDSVLYHIAGNIGGH